ncbi:hypothetical protein RCH22_004255 [Cryobacterium psychrotolerans]|nr:hypothetical protein [Cryobacterium psychrotolerans]
MHLGTWKKYLSIAAGMEYVIGWAASLRVTVIAPFWICASVISWGPGSVTAPAAAVDIGCDGLGCRSVEGARRAAFDVDVAKPGRPAVRTLCCKSLGHFFSERPDGCGAGRCLVGAVVRKYHDGVVLFQKSFSGAAEDLELGDIFVGGRVVVLGALQDHSLAREADG